MMLKSSSKESIVIIDFGSQYTHLIARNIRELGVYSIVVSPETHIDKIISLHPKGIILSGSFYGVYEADASLPNTKIFELGIPILGICYGFQIIVKMFGGTVRKGEVREFGRTKIKIVKNSPLFYNLPKEMFVWMSHSDYAKIVPTGFTITSISENNIVSSIEKDHIFATQFHPEVKHSEFGKEIISNFVHKICGASYMWDTEDFIEEKIREIKETVKDKNVISGLSGGIDSTVATIITRKAVGDRLVPVLVDTGLLRKNEAKELLHIFKEKLHLNVKFIDAKKEFLGKLKGVTSPEEKRKLIGREFIRVFERIATEIGGADYLVQGTLYPDVIESNGTMRAAKIKSHHNVGGLPSDMKFKLIEPLRELFKDEVREIGKKLGVPDEILHRHPFPGPGLAIRIIGEVTEAKLKILREADFILLEELRNAYLYNDIWQAFCVLLPIKSVGVMGDKRTYEFTVAIRIVQSSDGMTANWAELPYSFLKKVSSRIINEVKGINRVVYDISSKPPATIEWE